MKVCQTGLLFRRPEAPRADRAEAFATRPTPSLQIVASLDGLGFGGICAETKRPSFPRSLVAGVRDMKSRFATRKFQLDLAQKIGLAEDLA